MKGGYTLNKMIDILTIVYFVIAISATGSMVLKAAVSLALFVMIIFSYNCKIVLTPLTKYLFIFLAAVSFEILLSGNIPFSYVLSRFSLFFPTILFVYYLTKNNRYKITKIAIMIWIIISIRAAYLMTTGQLRARYLASHVDSAIPFSGGGYALAVGSALLAVFLLDCVLWKKNNVLKTSIVIALLFYVVIMTQSTTTIIALVVGSLASVIFRITSMSSAFNRKKIFILVALCLIILSLKTPVGNWLISNFSQSTDILSRRLVEFGAMLSNNNQMGIDMGDSDGRKIRLLNSLILFCKHPIFGITRITGTNHYAQAAFGVGSHGEFTDALARFGLFAGIPYLMMFVNGIKNVRNLQIKKMGFGYIICFLILFIFNPFLYNSTNVVLFFIMPMLVLFLNDFERNGDKC